MAFLSSRAYLIVGVALLLTLPAILSAPMTHDSFWIDWVWAEQFTGQLAHGSLYPRWLPQSHGGLGSPAFYYYPPLAFYVTGVFGLAGLSTYASILAAFFVGFAGSGFAMHAWLRGSAKEPMIGALLYMAAPYHLFDFYSRGALAEFLAIALIPVVTLGIRRASQGQLVIGALAYAALIMTHLPLALLTSLFLMAPYTLFLCWQTPRQLVPIAVSLLIGLAISAIYLFPALGLDAFRDSARLWGLPGLKPTSWSFLQSVRPGPPPSVKLIVGAMILILLQPVILLLFTRQRAWGICGGLCCILVAGLVPGFWSLPLLEAVQFPFRMLPLANFAVATGLAHVALPRLIVLAATVPLYLPAAVYFIGFPVGTSIPREKLTQYPDVVENLPPGERPTEWLSEWALALSRQHPKPRHVGVYTVDRVFYFPAWEVQCQGRAVATFPEPRTKLLTYKGRDCRRQLTMTTPEWIGLAISVAGWLLLVGLGLWSRMRLRRQAKRGSTTPEPTVA